MLQLNDTVEPESPGAAVLHPAETEEGVEVAFTPTEAGRILGHGASVACCPPLQTLTPFHVHNPTVQAKVKDYFVFRVSCSTVDNRLGRFIFERYPCSTNAISVSPRSSASLRHIVDAITRVSGGGRGHCPLSVSEMMLVVDGFVMLIPARYH